MNMDQIKGSWKQLKGRAQAQWGEITGDEWDQIEGNRKEIVGLIQSRYGRAKEEAEAEVDEWAKTL
ncbi:CsbD family protein [Phaeovulum sp.]|uniref:CsbD family protein n=1 Tax=Phaeovulum sp. TaxID=2934796 RepID=UPI0039E5467C